MGRHERWGLLGAVLNPDTCPPTDCLTAQLHFPFQIIIITIITIIVFMQLPSNLEPKNLFKMETKPLRPPPRIVLLRRVANMISGVLSSIPRYILNDNGNDKDSPKTSTNVTVVENPPKTSKKLKKPKAGKRLNRFERTLARDEYNEDDKHCNCRAKSRSYSEGRDYSDYSDHEDDEKHDRSRSEHLEWSPFW